VIFPFRSTFAIKYFQEAHGLTLEQASRTNSYVFMAAIFATPTFAFLLDRIGRHALLLIVGSALLPAAFLFLGADHVGLWIPTVLLGVSFSLVPAVLWPSITRYVTTEKLGTAYGLLTMLQNTGLTVANLFVGHLNDRSLASHSNTGGYSSMLWFFGLLSLTGLLCAALLSRSETLTQRRVRVV
jgi:MFS family permease